MPPFDRGDDDVERRQRPLELQPREASATWCVRARRVVGYQTVVAALAGVGEDPVEVGRARRFLEAREQERKLDAESLEQAPALIQRFVEQGASVQVEQVEDHEHDRHLAAKLGRHLLASKTVLELEEPQDPSISMSQNLAVE